MDLKKIIFHGKLEEVDQIKKFVEDIPEGTIKTLNESSLKTRLDACTLGERTIELKPVQGSIEVNTPSTSSSNNKYVDFKIGENNYRVFYEKTSK